MASNLLVLVNIFCFVTKFICGNAFSLQYDKVGIIGGHRISIEEVPFMASLRLNGTYHWCGASIIHEQFVLTAAHCIVPDRQYKVLVGTNSIDKGGELYEVEKIIPHENFAIASADFDICIIKLAKSLTFSSKVATINLPDEKFKVKKGSQLQVTGWGQTGPNQPVSENLLQVSITEVSRRSCQMSYLKALQQITTRMLCAGGNGKDSCQGDSGGPLTYGRVQVGLSSFGSGCGRLPGVYTKITVLLPWIKETIENNIRV